MFHVEHSVLPMIQREDIVLPVFQAFGHVGKGKWRFIALLALAASRTVRWPIPVAAAAGLLLGWAVFLNYGLVLMGLPALAVLIAVRNRRAALAALIILPFAWSHLVRDWPAIRKAFDAWLDPGNFDADGRQRRALAARDAAGASPLED